MATFPTFSTSIESNSDSEPYQWKYFPFELGESEDLENYEPGGFHPVHLGDILDGRYRVVHKLGSGGFSTVWLARDRHTDRWVALKIVTARDSATYESRSSIAKHRSLATSREFVVPHEQFWVDGPNGRHLVLVSSVLGPNLSQLSKGIYSRMTPAYARALSLQAARALILLHSNGLGHGDFTASNVALRLKDEFNSYTEADLLSLFGRPKTAPVRTYSEQPPGPHAPDYVVVPLDFCSSTINIFSGAISIIDFDQSFTTAAPPPKRPGIPAKYLAPEVCVGLPLSSASDVWALGCAIFRIRSGDDLFFDYDTDCPVDALRQVVKTMGDLPEEWKQTRFDEEGFAVPVGEEGDAFWTLEEKRPLDTRVREIIDEPPGPFLNGRGEVVDAPEVPPALFDGELRIPFPAALRSMVWRPTAICVDGGYFAGYSDETDVMLEAFPRISEAEAVLLIDLLSGIFVYDPAKRATAEELVEHPWFHSADIRYK